MSYCYCVAVSSTKSKRQIKTSPRLLILSPKQSNRSADTDNLIQCPTIFN